MALAGCPHTPAPPDFWPTAVHKSTEEQLVMAAVAGRSVMAPVESCSKCEFFRGHFWRFLLLCGSAGRRSRRQWGSACAMRLARSAPSCNQGWPGPPKIAQRRRDGWLRSGRRDPGRRRRLGQCVKTRITRRCAVRACFSTALKQGWARARTQTTQGGDMAGLHSSGSQAVNVS